MMQVLLPESIDALLDLLAGDPACRVMGGGTDLLVHLRAAAQMPDTIVCLERIAELKGVTVEGDAVRIGGATTITGLLDSSVVREKLPLLHRAAGVFASPIVRNMATIGGNICTASPAGDTLPPLYVMNASVELRSAGNVRTVPLEGFISGPRRVDLRPGELLTAVMVPVPTGFGVHHFEKVGQRAASAISVVSMAGLVALESGKVRQARFAWGSVGPTVVGCPQAEDFLAGRALTLGNLRSAAEMVRAATAPIDDVRASAAYRRQVAGNLLLRLANL
jgi:xanthine dehydrogenase FAD-binding subunit